jgi:hypothetical protein
MVQTHNLYFDTMLNYHLFQNLKLKGRGEFDYLINILTLLCCTIFVTLQMKLTFSFQASVSSTGNLISPKNLYC